jgi:hypothetical protein
MHERYRTAVPAEIAEWPTRIRQSARRGVLPPQTECSSSDDGANVRAALHGTRGAGRFMVVDADLWPSIVSRWGSVWVLNTNGHGRDYVRRSARAVGANARQPGECPTATLARLITGAKRGEVVLYGDGNPLNLRRANLEVVTKSEATRRRAANRAA